MDKLSGSCYFLERKLPETIEDVPWKKLQLPTTKERDLSPTTTTKKQEQLNNDWTIRTKETTMEEKDNGKMNGGVNLHKDNSLCSEVSQPLQKTVVHSIKDNELNENGGHLYIRSFKETTV